MNQYVRKYLANRDRIDRIMRFYILTLILCFFSALLYGADSLPADTTIANQLNKAAFEARTSDIEKMLLLSDSAYSISVRIGYDKGTAKALLNQGLAQYLSGQYNIAIEKYNLSMVLRRRLQDHSGIASLYNNMGIVCQAQGHYGAALQNHLNALKIRRQLSENAGIAASLNNLGNLYENMSRDADALKSYQQSLKILKKLDDKSAIAGTLNNIANIYHTQNRYNLALDNYKQALSISRELNNEPNIASALSNIGQLYLSLGELDQALDFCFQSLKMKKKLGDIQGICISLNNIGNVYERFNNLGIALIYQQEALKYAIQIGARDQISKIYQSLADIFYRQGDYFNAFHAFKNKVRVRDSIFSQQNKELLAQLDAQYHNEQNQAKIKLLEKDNTIQDLELIQKEEQVKRQTALNSLLIVCCVFAAAFAFMIFRNSRIQRGVNKKLEEKNELISQQKSLVEYKNKEITDSIHYALRIQQALLPPSDSVQMAVGECFLFFSPRDIVSGDFYWYSPQCDNSVVVVIADCVGHGVPGAFMTVVGSTLLNEIVVDKQILDMALVLSELDKRMNIVLHRQQTEPEYSTGMDVGILHIDRDKGILSFAGSKHCLYRIRNKELEIFQGSKYSIATHSAQQVDDKFFSHQIELNGNDWFYLSTDGFQDQFGGPNEKKFMTKHLKTLLLQTSELTLAEQKTHIESTFRQWKGDLPQTDDVLLLGFRA